MSGIFLRWGVPALVTVVGGTSLAVSATSGGMATDLQARAAAALAADEVAWASVTFDARDATITGTATDQQRIDAALARVAAVHGVRSVRAAVVLAERVSPYPFEASVADGRISLSGGIPDEAARTAIADASGADVSALRLLSGAPPSAAWMAAVDYGFAHLREFDQGRFALADLSISIAGRAKSQQAFDALARLDSAAAPTGVTVTSREVQPALVAPYEWHATFDGRQVAVTGYAPTADFAQQLRDEGAGGRPVSTSLVLASGEPVDFTVKARLLLDNLVRLEEGRADISGSTVSLSGAPPDQSTADSVRLAMSPVGAKVDLAPPRVASYTFSAIRTGGKVAIDGFVPDEATKAKLGALPGVDVSGLELGSGQPARFASAVEFGLALLDRMSEGRFTLENTTLAIEGRAETSEDFSEIETTLALGAPQGLILSTAAVRPPLATPFVWSATKAESGAVTLAGYVPGTDIRQQLESATPGLERDATTIADGGPENFETEAAAALGLLPLLRTASIEYDGSRWIMSGAVDSAEAGAEADRAFASTGLDKAGWSFSVERPAPIAAVPTVEPYVWQAEKRPDGGISFGGYVPTAALKSVLAGRVGGNVTDDSQLGAGNPPQFIPGALAGIDALALLDDGTLSFDGKSWSLSGDVPTAEQRQRVEGALQAAVDTSTWTVTIQALDAAPVVANYTWSATKASDGRVSLAGYVTDEDLRQFVSVRAGTVATDTTALASGEPPGFTADILAGLEALSHLTTGTVKFEGGIWTLAGVPPSQAESDLALAALGTATGAGAGWQKQLSAPVAPAVAAQPAAQEPETPAAPAATETQTAALPEAAATSAPVAVPHDFIFSAIKPPGEAIALRGAVPADPARRYFGSIAGDVPVDNVTLSPSLPSDFITAADLGIRTLAELSDGEFGLEDGRWVFTARAASAAQRDKAVAALAALPATASWSTSITLLPPLDLCRATVAAFASRNAIIFQSGSARITDESLPAVDELAADLEACPDAFVHVQGHTDADGDDEANLALSVARAEAVVDALIERGVGYQRLYAEGYGESLPVASNDTTAGKRANRRIAFSISAKDE